MRSGHLAQAEQPLGYIREPGLRSLAEGNHTTMYPKQIPAHGYTFPVYAHPPAKREAVETAPPDTPAPQSHLAGMPDRLWAWQQSDNLGSTRGWNETAANSRVEYVRADLVATPSPQPRERVSDTPSAALEELKAAWLMGRNAWCPAGIIADHERTERDWQEARAALEASHE